MINTFTLRFTLFFVRLVYYLAPLIKVLCKILFWIFIAFVTILLLLLII